MSKTHGQTGTPEYKIWKTMRQRCNNSKNAKYPDYGARGITVDPSWNSFEVFILDIGLRPDKSFSLERRNTNGNYTKDNCYWAPIQEQSNNKRNSVRYLVKGESKTLKELSTEYNIKLTTLIGRIYGLSWPIEKAIARSTMSPAECAEQKKVAVPQGRVAGSNLYQKKTLI